MGVPFLFQAIAERYPSLVANVTANQVKKRKKNLLEKKIS